MEEQEVQDLVSSIPKLQQVPDAAAFAEPDYWLWGGVAAGVLLLLFAVVWFLRRSRRAVVLPPLPSPAEQAVALLQALAVELPPLGACGVRVSLILRNFLAGETQDPALFETHEEFSRRLDSLSGVPESCRLTTLRLLDDLAALKYAPHQEDSPTKARHLIDEALVLVADIEAARREQPEEKEPVSV
ncbi:MAG: hypothetical protein PUD60_04815 [Akkermansia muciniphila]|nr:hypothetical protein [Akkermansia muciniphila]